MTSFVLPYLQFLGPDRGYFRVQRRFLGTEFGGRGAILKFETLRRCPGITDMYFYCEFADQVFLRNYAGA